MPALDPVTNFGIVTVNTTYDASATSIVLSSGHGARLPLPSATVNGFNLTWWNATDYSAPEDDPNVEIVRVTARSTDTLTVTRAQEGTSASTKNTAAKTYKMVLSPTKKLVDDLETRLSTGWNAFTSVTPTTGTFDAPSYPVVFAGVDLTTVLYPGMRVKITQSTVKCFIITAVSFSTDTTVTLYGGTDYSLVASGTTAISAFSYSSAKIPAGFNADPAKWVQRIATTSQQSGALDGANWLNIGTTASQLSIPIGAWKVRYRVTLIIDRTTAGTSSTLWATLSTGSTTESNADLTCAQRHENPGTNEVDVFGSSMTAEDDILLAAKTLYYLNAKCDSAGTGYFNINSNTGNTIIEAQCAYL